MVVSGFRWLQVVPSFSSYAPKFENQDTSLNP